MSSQAMAVCSTVATSPASFGSVSSINVNTTVQNSSTLNGGLSCGPSLIALGTSDHFYLTISSLTSGLVGPTGDVIGYTVYGNNSTSFPINRNTLFDFGPNGIATAAGLLTGPGNKSLPLYLGSITGSNVAAGVYTEVLTLAWGWDYCIGLGVGSLCVLRDKNLAPATRTLTVTLTVTNDCQITAPAISFGSAPVISGFATVNGQASVSCTKGSSYSVGLSDGQNPISVGGRRRMVSSGNYLAYDIFKSAGTTRWGSVGAARRDSSTAEINPGNGLGSGASGGSQVFNYNAKIYTDQTTPPGGTYLDNVVLDVGF
ncbi:spore coat protein U domain-containing protein [Pseudomonas sp. B22129]|uniref:Csu type fimbrial protein n=1 Tax=Pseudomonas sp. B22129 TaxID=3235111 RepID=UPI0037830DF0